MSESHKIGSELEKVLNGMVAHIGQENVDLYRKLFESRQAITGRNDIEGFFFNFVYPYNQFLEGLISVEIKSSHLDILSFLMINSQYVENHFEKKIVRNEGSQCSADKSSAIMESLFNYFTKGTEINWNYEQQYTYHLPKKVFKTHTEILEFFNAIASLFYGNPEKYLKTLNSYEYFSNQENAK